MADYFVEGGDVLENKLGITDPEQLREAEEDAFSDKELWYVRRACRDAGRPDAQAGSVQ